MDIPRFYDTTTTTDYLRTNKRSQFFKRIFGNQLRTTLILIILTIFSTWYVNGFSYAITIVITLLAHEMGHYLMCRKYGLRATLPFFIPFPFPMLNPFGTMGAVIRIEDRMPNRKVLFDVGIAGPLAGLVFTIPALLIGLKLSTVTNVSSISSGSLMLGDSLLFKLFSWLIFGAIPEGSDVILHPIAFAGWAGLFVTALNLLPLGQLDGGHVLYALFGPNSSVIYKIVFSMFIGVCAFFYPGWFLLILLLLWFGYNHPAPIDDFTPIDKRRRILGYVILIIFIISFTPVPFSFNN
jgi:membrane-associated protease RseP (regulator of RpoE activity)